MANFQFYLRDKSAVGKTRLYLRIHSNGKRLKYYTNQSIEPEFWDQEKQRVKKVSHAPEFNTNLKTLLSNAEQAFNRLNAELEHEPTPEQIQDELNKVYKKEPLQVKPLDFLTFFDEYTESIPSLVNDKTEKPLSKSTQTIFRRCLQLLKEYQTIKRKKLNFDDIDLNFYVGFKTFLETNHVFAANTVGKHIKRIKTVMNEATERGLNTNLQYKNKRFKVVQEQTQSIYLTESELQYIEQIDFNQDIKLNNVRDLFLLGCWTGLRFSDFSRLNKSHIKDGFITIKTQKMKTSVEVPVLPMAARIIEKYTTKDGIQLPRAISNQKMNEYLKIIGQLVPALHETFEQERTQGGMSVTTNKMKWELLTTHTARRSCATNLFISQDGRIPVSLIMEMTGHKTEKEFYKYIKMKPRDKATMLRSLFVEQSPLKRVK